jgi:hypothetical protein
MMIKGTLVKLSLAFGSNIYFLFWHSHNYRYGARGCLLSTSREDELSCLISLHFLYRHQNVSLLLPSSSSSSSSSHDDNNNNKLHIFILFFFHLISHLISLKDLPPPLYSIPR